MAIIMLIRVIINEIKVVRSSASYRKLMSKNRDKTSEKSEAKTGSPREEMALERQH